MLVDMNKIKKARKPIKSSNFRNYHRGKLVLNLNEELRNDKGQTALFEEIKILGCLYNE
jgi:hypothetical protein